MTYVLSDLHIVKPVSCNCQRRLCVCEILKHIIYCQTNMLLIAINPSECIVSVGVRNKLIFEAEPQL